MLDLLSTENYCTSNDPAYKTDLMCFIITVASSTRDLGEEHARTFDAPLHNYHPGRHGGKIDTHGLRPDKPYKKHFDCVAGTSEHGREVSNRYILDL